MKAITLHQPWAQLVASGIKTIETRSWSTKHRGPLAIHAGARKPPVWWSQWEGVYSQRDQAPWHDELERYCHGAEANDGVYGQQWRGPLGAVVATCQLVDVLPMVHFGDTIEERCVEIDHKDRISLRIVDPADWSTADISDQLPYGYFSWDRYAWLLSDVVMLDEPLPARGRQGLWSLERALRDERVRDLWRDHFVLARPLASDADIERGINAVMADPDGPYAIEIWSTAQRIRRKMLGLPRGGAG